ncbi:hypothetical protein Tco_1069785 [Tanacetum coccineum]|uniref:Uncharacterized protein n=1 Tax=Tanacetum coccineum TaxID=301880 RepID=A0ABQ5HJK0_9ASTR
MDTRRYVVPTGRVIATVSIKVPTGRKCSNDDNQSAGRLSRITENNEWRWNGELPVEVVVGLDVVLVDKIEPGKCRIHNGDAFNDKRRKAPHVVEL